MSGDPRPVGEDDLHSLIDGRLEPERQALVEAWLAENPARAAEVSADRVMRERLRARLAPIAEEAIPARLRVANIRSRYRYAGARWFPMAAAAVLCLAVGGAGGWVGHSLRGVAHDSDGSGGTGDTGCGRGFPHLRRRGCASGGGACRR